MEHEVKLLLATVSDVHHESVRQMAKQKGFLQAALHVYENLWTDEDRKRAKEDFEGKNQKSPYYRFLVDGFDTPGHFKIVDSHREFLVQTFQRLGAFCPMVTEDQIAAHDLSKYSLEQTIGYTARWVHHVEWNNPTWQYSLRCHFSEENHHPEHYYPAVDEMPQQFLEESFLDMVASRWQRQLAGKHDVTNHELVDFDPAFLSRYSAKDRHKVEDIVKRVRINEKQNF